MRRSLTVLLVAISRALAIIVAVGAAILWVVNRRRTAPSDKER